MACAQRVCGHGDRVDGAAHRRGKDARHSVWGDLFPRMVSDRLRPRRRVGGQFFATRGHSDSIVFVVVGRAGRGGERNRVNFASPHLRTPLPALTPFRVLCIISQLMRSSPKLSASRKNFELVIDKKTRVPMVLARSGSKNVAVSVDGFRYEREDHGSWGIDSKRNALLCSALLSLVGDRVQRTSFDLSKVKRSRGRQLNLYEGAWWMAEEDIPAAVLVESEPFKLLVPSDRSENFSGGFIRMLTSSMLGDSRAEVGPGAFASFLASAASLAGAGADAGAGAGAGSPSLFDQFLASAEPSKRQRVGDASTAVALAHQANQASPIRKRAGGDEARAEEAARDRSVPVVAADSDGAARAAEPLGLGPLVDDPTFNLPLAAAGASVVAVGPSVAVAGASVAAAGGTIPSSLPSPPRTRPSSWSSGRAAGGGAGGCEPLCDRVEACTAHFECSAAAALSRQKARSAVVRSRLRVDDDTEDDSDAVASVVPRFGRSSSFEHASDVAAFVSSADVGLGAPRPAEPIVPAPRMTPLSFLCDDFSGLDLHDDTFDDMPLSVLGPVCMFVLPRLRAQTEPLGVRVGLRCSFCWRWATQPCVECVRGGETHVVCDACVDRLSLDSVTCLACLPSHKASAGDECVKTRLSLKEASV